MHVDANRDDEKLTALVREEDVAVVATVTRDAEEGDLLEALAQLDEELEIGLAVLGATDSRADDDRDDQDDGASDGEVAESVQAVTDGGVLLNRADVVRELRDVHDEYLAASAHVASGRDGDALDAIREVREALDTAERALEEGI